jgi:hypothetical protein
MLPVIAKIVLVDNRIALGFQDSTQPHTAFICDFDVVVIFVPFRYAPVFALLVELMEMTVVPSHRCLESIVEATKQDGTWHLKASPDRWLNADQCDFEFV